MSTKSWEVLKTCYCHHVNQLVSLEAEIIHPADFIPDGLDRILAHRCSYGLNCNLDGRPSCQWAGSNPTIDPFSDPQ